MTVGAVLTGGASSRMGRNKALIEIAGTPMARRVAAALVDGGCTDVVLVGGDPAELAPLRLPHVADRHPGAGPLGGVRTAIAHADPVDVVVAACDLPRLDAATIAALVEAAAGEPQADVIVARTAQLEPACALWRATAGDPLAALFAEGVRAVHVAIARLHAVPVDVATTALVNMNRPDDLDGH